MKTSKKLLIAGIAILLIIVFIPTNPVKARGGEKFCQKVGSISTEMVRGMKSKKHKSIKTKTLDSTKLVKIRNESEKKRQDSIMKLYETYGSEAQRSAIDEYKLAVEQALSVRYQKTDQAREDFITQINILLNNNEESFNNNETKIITAVEAANALASSSCAEGQDSEVVKNVYKQSLQSAKQNFAVNKNQIELNKSKIDNLVQIRKQAIDSAMEEFKLSIDSAKQKLINSLK